MEEDSYGEYVSYDEASRLINKLAAHVERLREVICNISDDLYEKGFDVLNWHLNGDAEPLDSWFEENDWLSVLDETPAQSLCHIESRVEEETIERCINFTRAEETEWYEPKHFAELIMAMPRKYSNQQETVAKDGE